MSQIISFYSETIVVSGDEFLHLIECLEAFEKTILKHSVELVFNTGQQGVLLKDVEAKLIERGVPVKFVKIKEAETVNDLAHTSLHLSLIKILLMLKDAVFVRQLLSS